MRKDYKDFTVEDITSKNFKVIKNDEEKVSWIDLDTGFVHSVDKVAGIELFGQPFCPRQ